MDSRNYDSIVRGAYGKSVDVHLALHRILDPIFSHVHDAQPDWEIFSSDGRYDVPSRAGP
ncbi:hypothetical protein EST38_g2616 [Candolleomyces aberdarensis]|uniref:Uncharacterized protein n=1 Tax=Candolleomyces aberdarensis TaxID=2316362 RepID=A0A4Q2DWB7_9AGAR|nr:hypothetical protein EST38_g2616 [Candolleomyces aberdarensis]